MNKLISNFLRLLSPILKLRNGLYKQGKEEIDRDTQDASSRDEFGLKY